MDITEADSIAGGSIGYGGWQFHGRCSISKLTILRDNFVF